MNLIIPIKVVINAKHPQFQKIKKDHSTHSIINDDQQTANTKQIMNFVQLED
jgi:hypothetical protein